MRSEKDSHQSHTSVELLKTQHPQLTTHAFCPRLQHPYTSYDLHITFKGILSLSLSLSLSKTKKKILVLNGWGLGVYYIEILETFTISSHCEKEI